ncbi:uncharacterized protein TNCV_1785791 [Trichonephila clavipes]|nr:uncharacterized protein TNCV_1785791 [Trichonephila clavipes]
MGIFTLKKSPIHSLSVIPHRVWGPPNRFPHVKFSSSESALIRGFSIAFLSLIGTQTVPESPQFGFRCTSQSPYRFSSIAEGTSQRLPRKSSLKSIFSLGRSLSPYMYLSLTSCRLIILLLSLVLMLPLSVSAHLISSPMGVDVYVHIVNFQMCCCHRIVGNESTMWRHLVFDGKEDPNL